MTEELGHFWKYAAAFEEAYAQDDWAMVDTLFDENITWAVAGLPPELLYAGQGRENTSDAISDIVATLDRRFDNRVPRLTQGPTAIPGGVHFEFTVTYTRLDLPPFVLRGEEWDVFRDGKIAMHFEVTHNGMEAAEYLTKHNSQLIPVK